MTVQFLALIHFIEIHCIDVRDVSNAVFSESFFKKIQNVVDFIKKIDKEILENVIGGT